MNKNVNKKLSFIIFCIVLCFVILIIYLFKNDNVNKNKDIATTNNYIAYIKINPLIKLEYSQTCNEIGCSDPIVIKFDLINDDSKDIYKDIDLIGSNNNLFNVLSLIVNTAEDNNIEFENVEIYSNWNNLENYVGNYDNIAWSYTINIREKENLDQIENSLKLDKDLFTVEFDTNGGSLINSLTVEKGNLVKSPVNPTKAGYNFVEWQLDGKKYNFDIILESNIKLVAVWKKIENINDNKNIIISDKETDNNEDVNNDVLPDNGGLGDYFEDYCSIDFDSQDCLDQHGYFKNGDSYYYDEKELWSTNVISLKKCYDEVSCANTFGVTIYKYNKNNINLVPTSHKKLIFNSYLKTMFDDVKKDYNIVIKYNYVQQLDDYMTKLNGILKKYEEYKTQGIIENDDSILPENLQVKGNECNSVVCFTGYYSTINTVKGEISWTKDSLEDAKSDEKNVTNALNSVQELYNLFN